MKYSAWIKNTGKPPSVDVLKNVKIKLNDGTEENWNDIDLYNWEINGEPKGIKEYCVEVDSEKQFGPWVKNNGKPPIVDINANVKIRFTNGDERVIKSVPTGWWKLGVDRNIKEYCVEITAPVAEETTDNNDRWIWNNRINILCVPPKDALGLKVDILTETGIMKNQRIANDYWSEVIFWRVHIPEISEHKRTVFFWIDSEENLCWSASNPYQYETIKGEFQYETTKGELTAVSENGKITSVLLGTEKE